MIKNDEFLTGNISFSKQTANNLCEDIPCQTNYPCHNVNVILYVRVFKYSSIYLFCSWVLKFVFRKKKCTLLFRKFYDCEYSFMGNFT